ncbi:DUF1014-domain-containing protein [Piedraia hortae CBS 480.64]|uniref:DUF1014-domain-containing protein n=1 Tax=Piedraia hortae CBS 480.64 TaxID=1314780 RepID=A0A6A7CB01_9PEZI|nr:DUF1014-domain-containing protein [Piedraia hortae CBS 480.64]
MAGKKAATENSKKAAGAARKAEAASRKSAAAASAAEAAEAAAWQQGAKDTRKADAAASKAAEAARKKAEKEALLKEEEASLPTKGGKGKVPPTKKAKGLDLSGLDTPSSSAALNASGIDNALDALALTAGQEEKVERHPERRFAAAYKPYEERRLEELKEEKGLRRQQKIEMIKKEFEKSPDNPFNQVTARYDTSKEEVREMREGVRRWKEELLTQGGK